MRRLQNSLDRYSLLDSEVEALVIDTRTGKALRQLTDEMFAIAEDIRSFDIPVGTVLSSYDGAFTLRRQAGRRILDRDFYHRSGLGDYLAAEHPELLEPVSPIALEEKLGFDINGYYRSEPVTVFMGTEKYRRMMDIISEV